MLERGVPAALNTTSDFARPPEKRRAWHIPPLTFAEEMAAIWTKRGQAACAAASWVALAAAFNDAIANGHDGRWRVFPAETGLGKTTGMCLYAARLIEANREAAEPVGMLVAVRTCAAADQAAADILDFLPTACAAQVCAWHSELRKKPKPAQIRKAAVLVVTHKRYCDGLIAPTDEEWCDLVDWRHGERKLQVFNEAPALIEESRITARDLYEVLSLTDDLCERFPEQIAAVRKILARLVAERGSGATRIAWASPADNPVGGRVSMRALRTAAFKLPYDALAGKHSAADRRKTAERVDEILASVAAVLKGWAYFAQTGKGLALNTARPLVRPGMPIRGAVSLDATAGLNPLWALFRPARLVPVAKARRYGNVSLHVTRVKGAGKTSMAKFGKARMPRLVTHLADNLPKDRRVLIVTNKCAEAHARLEHPLAGLAVTHWGDLDGRNDWQDFDTVAIMGLQFRDDTGPINQLFATRGVRDDEWLAKPISNGPRGRVNAVRDWHRQKIAADIVQAANRSRCRQAIDAEGNCRPADIYAALPVGPGGDDILAAVRAEMPGVQVREWAFDPDGPRVPVIRKDTSHAAIVAFMKDQAPGEVYLQEIGRALGLTGKTRKNVAANLRNSGHPLTVELAEYGWTFVAGCGRGRGSRPYLSKLAGQRKRCDPTPQAVVVPEPPKPTRADRRDAFNASVAAVLAENRRKRLTVCEIAELLGVSYSKAQAALKRLKTA